jgi:hypothetical protein
MKHIRKHLLVITVIIIILISLAIRVWGWW